MVFKCGCHFRVVLRCGCHIMFKEIIRVKNMLEHGRLPQLKNKQVQSDKIG